MVFCAGRWRNPCLKHVNKPAREDDACADALPDHDGERRDGATRRMNSHKRDRGAKGRCHEHSKNASHMQGQREVARLLVCAGLWRRGCSIIEGLQRAGKASRILACGVESGLPAADCTRR